MGLEEIIKVLEAVNSLPRDIKRIVYASLAKELEFPERKAESKIRRRHGLKKGVRHPNSIAKFATQKSRVIGDTVFNIVKELKMVDMKELSKELEERGIPLAGKKVHYYAYGVTEKYPNCKLKLEKGRLYLCYIK